MCESEISTEITLAGEARLEQSHLWILGLGVDSSGSLYGPGLAVVGPDLDECECPGGGRPDRGND